MPTRLRAKVWPLAIGNELNINQTLYGLFAKRAEQMKVVAEREERELVVAAESRLKRKHARSRSNSLDDGNAAEHGAADIVAAAPTSSESVEMVGAESTMRSISVDLTRTFPTLSYFQVRCTVHFAV